MPTGYVYQSGDQHAFEEKGMIIESKKAVFTGYAISLRGKDGEQALLDIIAKDCDVDFGQELWATVEKIDGVQEIDYDGHFGNYIYIKIDAEHDTEATWRLIYDSINSYV